MSEKQVRVGVSCFVFRDGTKQILLGRRKGSHGAGLLACPGGHQDFGESFIQTGHRELVEECGEQFKVRYDRQLTTMDLMQFLPEKQYVDIALQFHYVGGHPRVMEPEKCDGWEWVDTATLCKRDDVFPGVKERLFGYHQHKITGAVKLPSL